MENNHIGDLEKPESWPWKSSACSEANIQIAEEHALCPKARVLDGLVLVYWGTEEEYPGTNGIRPLLSQLALGKTCWPDRLRSKPAGMTQDFPYSPGGKEIVTFWAFALK